MNTEIVSPKGETTDIETKKNTRDGIITFAGLTASIITFALTNYMGLSLETSAMIAPFLMTGYNVVLTYLCRKYNWLRVDETGTIIVGNNKI